MAQAARPTAGRARGGGPETERAGAFAALDLGTNNCRLLIATPTPGGFRVLESFSRIVRLGEGLSASGALGEAAMERALGALHICSEKMRRRRVGARRAVATQACRMASNGEAFIARVEAETGIRLDVISAQEEARLSVASCLNLLDPDASAALVVDVGGGSTELAWLDLSEPALRSRTGPVHPDELPILAWLSVPMGVVTLAEGFPEQPQDRKAWFRAMVDAVKARVGEFDRAEALRPCFLEGRAHLVGSSGAITSLAGVHLRLPRYDRNRVDGLWMTQEDCEGASDRLLAMDVAARAKEPCIGSDRADLVLAGAAILQAVQELWPCPRVRVADRGLREGILCSLMAAPPKRRRRRRRGGGTPPRVAAAQ